MTDLYLDKRKIDIGAWPARALLVLCLALSLSLAYLAAAGMASDFYLRKARSRLSYIGTLNRALLVKRSMAWRQLLGNLDRSIAWQRHNPLPYYEYAQALVQIEGDGDLRAIFVQEADDGKGGRLLEKAVRFYRKAIRRDPFNGVYHLSLGRVYSLMGDRDAAEKEFSCAEKLDPQNVSIQLFLARYWDRNQNEQRSGRHLDKVVFLYNASLRGGGPLGDMVCAYFKEIGKEDLLK